jgi:hypothetical protein
MAQYKIVGNYKIVDVEPNPDVTLAPNPASPNQTYSFSVDSPEALETLIIENARTKALGTSQTAAADADVLAIFEASEDTVDA